MAITFAVEIHNNHKSEASCVDSWHYLGSATVGAELIAAVLCIVLIWTLIRYRRRGRV